MTRPVVRSVALSAVLLAAAGSWSAPSQADDWPQWRGPNRDGKVTGFTAPKAWPKELTKKWRVSVGDAVATPALVGDKLFVFTRQGGNEVIRCLDAATGAEQWKKEYPAVAASGPASGFPGPRSSPTVVDGKVVLLGANGTLSCFDTAGTQVWQKNDYKGSVPMFFTSSSPVVADGLCVAQFGGERGGGVAGFSMADGSQKWKWTEDGTAYASPIVVTIDGTKMVVAETANNIVGFDLGGKQLWKTAFSAGGGKGGFGKGDAKKDDAKKGDAKKGGFQKGGKGGGRAYNAATPAADGRTVVFSGVGPGRGTKAIRLEKTGDTYAVKDLWTNPDTAVQYNSPVIKNGLVYGITAGDELFCINLETGKTAWTAPFRNGGGYGSVVDLGPVLMALNRSGKMVVFEPTDKEYKEVAAYTVADGKAYAYPVVAGNRVYIKDGDAVTLYTIE